MVRGRWRNHEPRRLSLYFDSVEADEGKTDADVTPRLAEYTEQVSFYCQSIAGATGEPVTDVLRGV